MSKGVTIRKCLYEMKKPARMVHLNPDKVIHKPKVFTVNFRVLLFNRCTAMYRRVTHRKIGLDMCLLANYQYRCDTRSVETLS